MVFDGETPNLVMLAAAAIVFALVLGLVWRAARKSSQTAKPVAVSAPAPASASSMATPMRSVPSAPAPVQAPRAPDARQPSYTEIALAAGGGRVNRPTAAPPPKIDYAGEATTVPSDASYAAVAVAAAASRR
jgi:hypothetical protein